MLLTTIFQCFVVRMSRRMFLCPRTFFQRRSRTFSTSTDFFNFDGLFQLRQTLFHEFFFDDFRVTNIFSQHSVFRVATVWRFWRTFFWRFLMSKPNFRWFFPNRDFFCSKWRTFSRRPTFFLGNGRFFRRWPFFPIFLQKLTTDAPLVVRGWVTSAFSVALTFVLRVVGLPLSAIVAIEISYNLAPLGAVLPVLEHFYHHVW